MVKHLKNLHEIKGLVRTIVKKQVEQDQQIRDLAKSNEDIVRSNQALARTNRELS